MSRRYLIPTNLFYRENDPLPPEFPQPNEGDVYFNTVSRTLRIYQDDGSGFAWRDLQVRIDTGDPDNPIPPIYDFTSPDGSILVVNSGTGIVSVTLSGHRMNWRGDWNENVVYAEDDVVRANGWTMIANTGTTEYPTPQAQGEPYWGWSSGLETMTTTTSLEPQYVYGVRVSVPDNGYISGWRVWVEPGNRYQIWVVSAPGGPAEDMRQHAQFDIEPTADPGWLEFSIAPELVLAGEVFDVVVVLSQEDPTAIEWTGDWAYSTPNNFTAPSSGQVTHASKERNVLRFHKTDDDSGDRSAELLALSPGDTITVGAQQWLVQSVVNSGSFVSVFVSPHTQLAPDVTYTFTFGSVTEQLLPIPSETGALASLPSVQGLYGATYAAAVTSDDDAYGIDLKVQAATLPQDWDIVASPGGGGGGGGVGPHSHADQYDAIGAAQEALDAATAAQSTATAATDAAIAAQADIDAAEIEIANVSAAVSTAQTAANDAQSTADAIPLVTSSATAPPSPRVGDLWIDTSSGNLVKEWTGSAWTFRPAGTDAIAADAITPAQLADAAVTAAALANGSVNVTAINFSPADIGAATTAEVTTAQQAADDADAKATQAAADAQAALNASQSTVVTFSGPTAPSNPSAGWLWFDTDDQNKLYRYNSTTTQWDLMRDDGLSQAISDSSAALAGVDGKITTFYQDTAPTADAEGDLWVETDEGNRLHRWSGTAWELIQDAAISAAQADASQALIDALNAFNAAQAAQADADTALANAAVAQSTADLAQSAAGSAQTAADAAQTAADDAATAAATAQSTADGKIVTFYQGTSPTAQTVGDLWVETDEGNRLHRWSGSAWILVQDEGISDALTSAGNAQSTADGKVTTFYQASAPTAEGVGDLWVDTDDDNKLYRWSGSAWQSVRDGTIADAQADAAQALADALAAQNAADSAQGTANTAQSTALAAQAAADAAQSTGNAAQSAADVAQATANAIPLVTSSATAPSAPRTGDLWIDEGNGNVVKEWTGSAWSSRPAGTAAIANNAVGTSQIADDAITSLKIATDAVTSDAILADSISAIELSNGAVTNAILAAGAVTDSKIADGAVTAGKVGFSIGGGNLMPNSSMEDGGGSVGTYWPASPTNGSCAFDGTEALYGSRSLKITCNTTGIVNPSAVYHPPMKPNTTYTMSAWVLNPSTNTSSVSLRAGGSTINEPKQGPYYSPSDDWQRMVHTFTTSSLAGTLSFYLYGNNIAGESSWFDGIQLEEGDVATAYAPKPDEILPGTITGTEIADDSITTPKLVSGSVTTAKVAAGAITASEIDSGAITADKIQAGAIGTVALAAGAVIADKIAANTITSGQIAAGAITTAAITAGSVTATQLAANSVVAGKIAANAVTAGTIAANAVTASTLAANAVTAGKIAANAVTAGTINANAITTGTIAANAITADKIQAGAIGVTALAANSVTTTALAASSVTSAKITAGAITATELAAGSVVAGKVATDAIAANNIVAGAVTSDKIAANAITAGKISAGAVGAAAIAANTIIAGSAIIQDGAITTAKIGDAAVTNAKIENLSANKITTGFIQASQAIKVGVEGGRRVEMNAQSLMSYDLIPLITSEADLLSAVSVLDTPGDWTNTTGTVNGLTYAGDQAAPVTGSLTSLGVPYDGMLVSWESAPTTDGDSAAHCVNTTFDVVAGDVVEIAMSVLAAETSLPWSIVIPGYAQSEERVPDGQEQTAKLTWTAPSTITGLRLGIQVAKPADGWADVAGTSHLVTSVEAKEYVYDFNSSEEQVTWKLGTGSDDNFFSITRPGHADETLASIDSAGDISGRDISASRDLIVGENLYIGTDHLNDILASLPQGVVEWADTSTKWWFPGGSSDSMHYELAAEMKAGRNYRISVYARLDDVATGDRDPLIRLRVTTDGSQPTTSSSIAKEIRAAMGSKNNNFTYAGQLVDIYPCTSDRTYRAVICYNADGGGSASVLTAQYVIEDIGPLVPSRAIARQNSATSGTPTDTGSGSSSVKQYTKTWTASWSGSYKNRSTYNSYYGSKALQGYYSGTNGVQASLIGFPIGSTLNGATIKKVEVYLYAAHWYYNAGGTAVIRTHQHTSRPGSFSTESGSKRIPFKIGQGKWVDITSIFENNDRGVTLDPGNTTNRQYYGRFHGAYEANKPKLRVTYTK